MRLVSILLSLPGLSWSLPDLSLQQLPLGTSLNAIPSIREVLQNSSIIPDVLDDFEPLYHIDLTYQKHHDQVLLGNEIKVKHVKKRPAVTIQPIIPSSAAHSTVHDKTYTLVLTDPDAKSRSNPRWSEMCHWILTNLTVPLPIPLELHETKLPGELIGYKPPGPPKKTGPHRYVFVMLEGYSNQTALVPPAQRQHWGYGKVRHGVRDWAQENNLTIVGANFFYAKHKKQ